MHCRRRAVRGGPADGVHRRAVAAHLYGKAGRRAARLGVSDAADRSAADGGRQRGVGDVRRDAVLDAHARQAQGVVDVIDDGIERVDQLAGVSSVEEIIVVTVVVAKVRLRIRPDAMRGPGQVVQVVDIGSVGTVGKYGIEFISSVDNRSGLCVRVSPMAPVITCASRICSIPLACSRFAVCQENDVNLFIGFVLFPCIRQCFRMLQGFVPVGSLMMAVIIDGGYNRRIAGAVNNIGNRIIAAVIAGRTKVITRDGNLDHIAEIRVTGSIVAQQALNNCIQRLLLGFQTIHSLIYCSSVYSAIIIIACPPSAVPIVHSAITGLAPLVSGLSVIIIFLIKC